MGNLKTGLAKGNVSVYMESLQPCFVSLISVAAIVSTFVLQGYSV